MITNRDFWKNLQSEFTSAEPFDHVVIDDFWLPEVAEQLVTEFPAYDSDQWTFYHNVLEDKKTCNQWDRFPKTTYAAFDYLMSNSFTNQFISIVYTRQ